MKLFKSNIGVFSQTCRCFSSPTHPRRVLIRPLHPGLAAPPRQPPNEEPPSSPAEIPLDAPEVPEPASPEVPGIPPNEAPETTPSEVPQEEGRTVGLIAGSPRAESA